MLLYTGGSGHEQQSPLHFGAMALGHINIMGATGACLSWRRVLALLTPEDGICRVLHLAACTHAGHTKG